MPEVADMLGGTGFNPTAFLVKSRTLMDYHGPPVTDESY